MKIVNIAEIEEEGWLSPKGTFESYDRAISVSLGRDKTGTSSDPRARHPFDVQIMRIPSGKRPYPFHSHSAQWEFYFILSGTGTVRHDAGHDAVRPGDAFMFGPGEAHTFHNDGGVDLVVQIIADNPIGESAYYPDSNKWLIRSPQLQWVRGDALHYLDGEE